MSDESLNRLVAIVGRPNVGKSSIFNRLVGRRLAIVHEESGVTRDRLVAEARWSQDRFNLIDTGGVGNIDRATSADQIERGVREQVDIALEDASVVIFVVDLSVGVQPLDEEVARLLRESGRTVFVAANKADTVQHDDLADSARDLGFDTFPVSALHNRGFGDLMDAVLAMLPETANESLDDPLRVAIVGRPNVGKSSYVNRLLRSDRVIVSDTPGTTRDSIDVPFQLGLGPQARHYVLTDTAGIRRRGKVSTAVEKFSSMRAESSIKRADVVIMMIDATTGATAQDKKIAGLIQRENRGCLLVVNKWDCMDGTTQRTFGPQLYKDLFFLRDIPVVYLSAKTGYNIRKSVEAVDHVAAQIQAQLPTGVLNRVVHDAFDRVQAPVVKGRPLKVYYCTQVGRQPLRIEMFVNAPRGIQPAYRTYIEREIRSHFGLEGAPLVLRFRSRHKEDKRR